MKIKFFIIFITFISTAGAAENCTFENGFNLGLARDPYKETCTLESETIFLKGYAIGRKMSWVESDLSKQNKIIACLHKDRSRTRDDFDECESDVNMSPEILNAHITAAEKLKSQLTTKRLRLQKLRDRASAKPALVDSYIQEYESEGPIDELDVRLRWKSYVAKKGGPNTIDSSVRAQIAMEQPQSSPLPSELVTGSLIGFGLGHYRQNRFSETGWKYAALDTAVAIGLVAGTIHKNTLGAMIAIFGIPFSRFLQIMDVEDYHQEKTLDIDHLKTHNRTRPPGLYYTWVW